MALEGDSGDGERGSMRHPADIRSRWSILYFGDRWDDFWRRRQQLAFRLSQQDTIAKVLYVEDYLTLPSFMKYLLRKGRSNALERWERTTANCSLIHSLSDKLTVISPLALLPLTNYRLLKDLDYVFRGWGTAYLLDRLMPNRREQNWLLWVSIPWIPMSLLRRFEEMPLWYDCTEDFSTTDTGFPLLIKTMCLQNDLRLTETADVVSISARTLYEARKGWNKQVYWLPNAVDTEMFAWQDVHEEPLDIANLPHPRIAFVGAINHQRDWTLIEFLASLHPEWSFVIIGPVKDHDIPARLESMLCVHFLGPRPYLQLPAYLQHCQACLEFYKPGRLSQSGQSLKIPLYLAAGKPVVATPSDGAEYFRDVVEIATSTKDFAQRLEAAIANDNDALRQQRKQAVIKDSWSWRVEQVWDIFEKHFIVEEYFDV